MPVTNSTTPWTARITIKQPANNVVEVVWTDYLGEADIEYLSTLQRFIERAPNKTHLLYSTLDLKGYNPKFPLGHVDFFTGLSAKLDRIAVVHTMPSLRFAIVTVSLASNTNMKGFPTLGEAEAWLNSP